MPAWKVALKLYYVYVDDCILYRNIESTQDTTLLQKDLHLLKQWEKKWKMSFNVNKCLVLPVTQKRSPIQANYFLHSTQLMLVESAKYLGVTIDSKLSFNQHVNSICKRANSVLGSLQRNFTNCPCKVEADHDLRICHNYISSLFWNMLYQFGHLMPN